MKIIKTYEKFINEFVNEPVNIAFINARMQELKDIVVDTKEGSQFEWKIDSKDPQKLISGDSGDIIETDFATPKGKLIAKLTILKDVDSDSVEYELDFDGKSLKKSSDMGYDNWSEKISSIEEGIDIIEKEIYKYIGVSESNI